MLVASGDLLLGGRVLPDGTLALPERDHTYDMSPGAVPVSADPLRSIHDLVEQIAAHGIRQVEGHVLVDASLFREAKGEAGGTGQVVISPIMINDNLVDVVVRPASRVGEAGNVYVAPETAYVKIINKTRTTAAAAVVLMPRWGRATCNLPTRDQRRRQPHGEPHGRHLSGKSARVVRVPRSRAGSICGNAPG